MVSLRLIPGWVADSVEVVQPLDTLGHREEGGMKRNEIELISTIRNALGEYELTPLITWALRFFLRNAYESLVIVDRQGHVQFMDNGSEKLFGIPRGGAHGLDINDLLPDTILPRVLQTGYPSAGRVLNVRGVNKISSSYPLMKGGRVIGAIGRVLFHSLEEVEKINEEATRLRQEVKSMRQRERNVYRAPYTLDHILGTSPALKECVHMAEKIAKVNADVLLSGESGTGKELFAQAIHNLGRPERPFVRVNCPAIPLELAESEFFGYERGAFTGADPSGRKGKFEAANNGTVFLDEVNSLPLSIQAKLLRVIQEREVEKLGSTRSRKLDFKIIAATNVDLKRAVEAGSFRKDLYYRIARTAIDVPPLRSRREDIPVYVRHFLVAINQRFGTGFKGLSREALSCMIEYDWPGNVRDLVNALEQACLKTWTGEELPLDSLPSDVIAGRLKGEGRSTACLREEMAGREITMILETLKAAGGNKKKAAAMLRIPRSTLYNKLKTLRMVT